MSEVLEWSGIGYFRCKLEIVVEEVEVECDDAWRTSWVFAKISLEVSCLVVSGKHLRYKKYS
jgi:hypothetical protein